MMRLFIFYTVPVRERIESLDPCLIFIMPSPIHSSQLNQSVEDRAGGEPMMDGGSERRIGADDEQIRGLTGIVRQMQDKYRNLAYAFWVRFSLCQHIISQRES